MTHESVVGSTARNLPDDARGEAVLRQASRREAGSPRLSGLPSSPKSPGGASAASLLPLARSLLALGGDERIAVNSATGRNRYGTPLLPAPEELWFSSSTASAISPAGLDAALAAIDVLITGSGDGQTAQQRADAVRARILDHFGAPGSTAILTASGTEAELIALAVARAVMSRPLTNVVVAPTETGSGVMAAAAGRHFLGTTSLGAATPAGTPLAGLEHADVRVEAIAIRAPDGHPLAAAEIDAAAAQMVATAILAERDVLLHVLDCSKSGLAGLGRDTARALSGIAPGRVLVVVDACQMRAPPDDIRRDLEAGFMVMVTGSKFAGGPPFSGALLLPGALATRLAAAGEPPPPGLAAFSAQADWPAALHGWCRGRLTTAANPGLELRWAAALAELDRYLAFDEAERMIVLGHFEQAVVERAGKALGADAVRVEDAGIPSIVPIAVAKGPDAIARATVLHQRLREPQSWTGDVENASAMARVCHVGQPVALGATAILRVCASAPMLSAVHERMALGASIEDAFAPIATDLDTLFRKWALLAAADLDVAAKPAEAHPRTAVASSPLDPADWNAFRQLGYKALDGMVEHLCGLRDGPVWRPMPTEVRERFNAPLPVAPRDLSAVLADFETSIKPYATGNTHPMFMGWVHGAGTPAGMIAEMLAAGLNANCGGRDHVGIEVERQVVRWAAEMLGMPPNASGVLVTGTSMANFLAVLVARDAALGHGVRRTGLARAGADLVAYTSAEVHGCIGQALELAGIGSDQLRKLAVDDSGALDVDRLETAILADRSAGLVPFLIVGTAGTVNTGAVDPLSRLAEIARREQIWFHVDAAFGALGMLAPGLKPLLAGIEQAQSVAFDFHKWGHVPYDAGCLVVRDREAHRGTFASPAAYLSRLPKGLAAGDTWPCDLGPDLSRSFRALKTWLTIEVHGADRLGAAIEGCCRVARHLADRVESTPGLVLAAPVALNIVCIGLATGGGDVLIPEIIMDLHERGVAAPSLTTLAGRPVIRCAIVNHRTTEADADRLLDEIAISLERLLDARMRH
ncbi:MAG: aminotransferase class V-fold PLP-dependent enzyme [Hyphomicrobiaceae bacterium]|nr:aminotransferase class V-fold PLP-dependent enzyme [Hyphomicrobiaceae bacterium]